MKDYVQTSTLPTKRLKYLVTLRRSPVTESGEALPYIGLENIESQTGRLVGDVEISGTTTPSADEGDKPSGIYFKCDDVLFGTLRPYLMKAWVAEFPGRCTTEALVMTPHAIEPRFLRSVCLSPAFIDSVDASTFGSKMPRAEWSFIGNMRVPIPTWKKQHAIADYLDRETARVDALVAAKGRLLDLLAEKRHALIVHAVTRGIESSATSRVSGVSWPDEIPAHWKMGRLKDFGSLIAGTGFPHEFQGVEGEILPFYKVGDLATSRDERHMEQPPNTVSFETATRLRAHVVPEGAIVYAKIGAALLLNRRRITTSPCVIDNNMTAYIPSKGNLTSGWAFYWTSILDFGMLANPGAVPSLSEGDQARMPIAIPPVDEQHAIVDHLDRETARLDELAAKTRETIALLKERRTALVSAAVTGQMDMENAA